LIGRVVRPIPGYRRCWRARKVPPARSAAPAAPLIRNDVYCDAQPQIKYVEVAVKHGLDRSKRLLRSRLARGLRKARAWTLAHPGWATAGAGLSLSLCYLSLAQYVQRPRLASMLDGVFGGLLA